VSPLSPTFAPPRARGARPGEGALAAARTRPRNDRDAAKDIARDLAEIAAHIGQLKGDANAYLTDPNYNTLRVRLENAHAAVEAATVEAKRRVRLNEEDASRR
jgi:ABC-type Na+ efflux pump permease subunit